MERIKVICTTILSALMSWLGILAVPVLILVGCNVLDYATGLVAAPRRAEQVNSYKGLNGIIKKICMWGLVLLGSWMDALIRYAAEVVGVTWDIPFIIATVVAVWLVINEMISILENMLDIGVTPPPFLMPIAKYIKKQVEDVSQFTEENGGNKNNEDNIA